MLRRCKCSKVITRPVNGRVEKKVIGKPNCKFCAGNGRLDDCSACAGAGLLPGAQRCGACTATGTVAAPAMEWTR